MPVKSSASRCRCTFWRAKDTGEVEGPGWGLARVTRCRCRYAAKNKVRQSRLAMFEQIKTQTAGSGIVRHQARVRNSKADNSGERGEE